jgi:cell division septum initiation protein DivIVA
MNLAKKSFLSWVGFEGEQATAAPSENALERIRQLEAQLNDMRSRRDITSLTKEEFEILATETAMSIIKSAQQRESRAAAQAERALSESSARAKSTLEAAESKAKAVLSGAESRGRKYLEAAETEAAELRSEAERAVESLVNSKKREAGALLASAKQEAERIISAATSEIADYRGWLTSAISESERLYRIQTQSLAQAESAISQSRARLQGAFERLAGLQGDIDGNLTADNRPRGKTFARGAELARVSEVDATIPEAPVPSRSAAKPSAKKPAAKKSAKKPVKSAAKKRK